MRVVSGTMSVHTEGAVHGLHNYDNIDFPHPPQRLAYRHAGSVLFSAINLLIVVS